ncbi:MAG: hypothetical protein ACTSX8_08970 [Alphaproteobacteria bacterium]
MLAETPGLSEEERARLEQEANARIDRQRDLAMQKLKGEMEKAGLGLSGAKYAGMADVYAAAERLRQQEMANIEKLHQQIKLQEQEQRLRGVSAEAELTGKQQRWREEFEAAQQQWREEFERQKQRYPTAEEWLDFVRDELQQAVKDGILTQDEANDLWQRALVEALTGYEYTGEGEQAQEQEQAATEQAAVEAPQRPTETSQEWTEALGDPDKYREKFSAAEATKQATALAQAANADAYGTIFHSQAPLMAINDVLAQMRDWIQRATNAVSDARKAGYTYVVSGSLAPVNTGGETVSLSDAEKIISGVQDRLGTLQVIGEAYPDTRVTLA